MKKTKPIFEILNRLNINDEKKTSLEIYSQWIEELVNFGTHILKWDLDEATGKDENIPIVMMFRNFLEHLDSISILVKSGSIDPTKSIARGLLEIYLGLEYILEDDTINRAMGFLVWHYKNELKVYKKLKPNTEEYKNFKNKISKNGIPVPQINNIDQSIIDIENLLKLPIYSVACAEYDRTISSGNNRKKNPNWYELFNGPQNIENLANYLNKQTLYEAYYRSFSGTTHGTNIIQGRMTISKNREPSIIQLRYTKDVEILVKAAFNITIAMYTLMLKKRVSSHKKEFAEWYLPDISKIFNSI